MECGLVLKHSFFKASPEKKNQELKDLDTEEAVEYCQSNKLVAGRTFLNKFIVSLAVWAVAAVAMFHSC
jgi:hypothetical protein